MPYKVMKKRHNKQSAPAKKAVDIRQDHELTRIKRKLKPEIKWSLSGAVFGDLGVLAGKVYDLAEIGGGALNTQRVGLTCNLKSIDIRLYMQNVVAQHARARVLMVKWSDDTAALVGNVLFPTGTLANPANLIISPINPIYRSKFQVLYDKTFVFGRDYEAAVTEASAANSSRFVRIRKSLKDVKQVYTDDDPTSGIKNRLYLIIVADNTSQTFSFQTMTRYIDS